MSCILSHKMGRSTDAQLPSSPWEPRLADGGRPCGCLLGCCRCLLRGWGHFGRRREHSAPSKPLRKPRGASATWMQGGARRRVFTTRRLGPRLKNPRRDLGRKGAPCEADVLRLRWPSLWGLLLRNLYLWGRTCALADLLWWLRQSRRKTGTLRLQANRPMRLGEAW